MQAIVSVRFGKLQGKKAVMAPGERLTVGRTERADFVVKHDAQMSTAHFQLSWDGARCELEDMGSVAGTRLNGEIAEHADVPHGSFIQAGETVLMVHFEHFTPPRMGADTRMTPIKAAALAALASKTDPLYAVLDAARSQRIPELLRESVEQYGSLYDGVKGDALADVAPHLVHLPSGARLTELLVREGWGKRWGIYLTHPRPFAEVRAHLRRFLRVQDDASGETMYFRYYDPAVLRVFLPACSVRQRADFFREATGFFAEGERGEVLAFAQSAAAG